MVKLYLNEEYEREKLNDLVKVSNPKKVVENAIAYFNDPNIKVYLSSHKYKKYAITDPITKKLINFGDIRYSDFTQTNDKTKQKSYLNRATKIKGDWKDNKYSANNLAINLLWQ
jgi:hypothetical protein